MNRYPVWKYALISLAVVLGLVYAMPNLFGEQAAVQISSARITTKVTAELLPKVQDVLKQANIAEQGATFEWIGTSAAANGTIKVRLKDSETQLKAKDALAAALNPNKDEPTYIVALNLLSSSPQWLTSLGALPMYLGLDLRGGVHFLMSIFHEHSTN